MTPKLHESAGAEIWIVMHQEICYENLHSRFPMSNLIGFSVVKDFCIVVTDFCTVVTDFCTPLRD